MKYVRLFQQIFKEDRALYLSAIFIYFISVSTIITLDQARERRIIQSQAQSVANDGPGGFCDLGANKGCGGDNGCRHWEKCSNNYSCIDTTNRGSQPASADACGQSAYTAIQASPVPQPTNNVAVPTAAQAQQPPPSSGSCNDSNWFCLGECAAQEVRNIFGGDAARWRREKANNEGKPGACDSVSSQSAQPTQAQPTVTQYSTTSCYVKSGTEIRTYPAGYCSPTSTGNPYLYCNNTAGLTPNTSGNSYIGWVQDSSGICPQGKNLCIGSGFIPSGGFGCCSGQTGSNGSCTQGQAVITSSPVSTPQPTNSPTPRNTSSPMPTYTPVPVTSGPTNTSMPRPTATPTPSPTWTVTPSPTLIVTTVPPTAIPRPATNTPTQIIPTFTQVPPTTTPVLPTLTSAPTIDPSLAQLCLPTFDAAVTLAREYKAGSYPLLTIQLSVSDKNQELISRMNNQYSTFIRGKADVLHTEFQIEPNVDRTIASVWDYENCKGSNFCQKWYLEENEFSNGQCPNTNVNPEYILTLRHELIHNIQQNNDPRFISNHFGNATNLTRVYSILAEGVAYVEGDNLTANLADKHSAYPGRRYISLYYILKNWSLSGKGGNDAYVRFQLAGKGHWDSFCHMRELYLENPADSDENFPSLIYSSIGIPYLSDDSDEYTLEECLAY